MKPTFAHAVAAALLCQKMCGVGGQAPAPAPEPAPVPSNNDDWQAISGGGKWNPSVARGTSAQCGVHRTVKALSGMPCECTCGGNLPGCKEDSAAMFNRTGYTCSQMGSAKYDYLHCNQLVRDITAEEAYEMWLEGSIDLIIDVRSPSEYASEARSGVDSKCGHKTSSQWDGCDIGHIPGAYLVPLTPWDASGLAPCKAMTVATTCYNHASHPESAWRSNSGAALLEQAGFKCVFNIVDGTKGWRDRGFPVVKDKPWPTTPPTCSSSAFYQAGKAYRASARTTAAPTPAVTREDPVLAAIELEEDAEDSSWLWSILIVAVISAIVFGVLFFTKRGPFAPKFGEEELYGDDEDDLPGPPPSDEPAAGTEPVELTVVPTAAAESAHTAEATEPEVDPPQ